MAVTGVLMIGFVVVHMTGNLQMFAGTPDKINGYAHFLKSSISAVVFSIGLIGDGGSAYLGDNFFG